MRQVPQALLEFNNLSVPWNVSHELPLADLKAKQATMKKTHETLYRDIESLTEVRKLSMINREQQFLVKWDLLDRRLRKVMDLCS